MCPAHECVGIQLFSSMEKNIVKDSHSSKIKHQPQRHAIRQPVETTTETDAPVQPSRHDSSLREHMLYLQRTTGNAAVQRLIGQAQTETSPAERVRRLMTASAFQKKTSLMLRKGKSAAVFSQIRAALQTYQGPLQASPPGQKIDHLRQILALMTNWLNSDQSKGSSRKKHVVTLKAEVETEIQVQVQQLESLEQDDFSDSNRTGGKDDAVGGQMNRLDLVKYGFGVRQEEDDEGNIQDLKDQGGEFSGYFKADVDKDPLNGNHRGAPSGVPVNNPEYGKRNLAMYELDKLLGAGVLPPTFAAKHNGKTGIIMQKVEGATGDSVGKSKEERKEILNDPVARRGLSNLYLLDIIAGQVDRHHGNFIVEIKGGKIVGIKGIDNDLSFGKDYKDINYDTNKKFIPMMWMTAGKTVHELDEIDQTMAQKIVDLAQQEGRVRAALSGLLSKDEIDSTISRLKSLAKHLQPLIGQPDGPVKVNWN